VVEDSVGAVHGEVQGVRGELAGVDSRVQRLEGKIDDASTQLASQSTQLALQNSKMDEASNQLAYTNQGMNLLCNVVAESMGNASSESVKRLQTFAASTGPARSASIANTSYPALDAPPVLVEIMKTSPEIHPLTASLPNPVMTLNILGGSWGSAGSRSSANLSSTYPGAGALSMESDNPPEPLT